MVGCAVPTDMCAVGAGLTSGRPESLHNPPKTHGMKAQSAVACPASLLPPSLAGLPRASRCCRAYMARSEEGSAAHALQARTDKLMRHALPDTRSFDSVCPVQACRSADVALPPSLTLVHDVPRPYLQSLRLSRNEGMLWICTRSPSSHSQLYMSVEDGTMSVADCCFSDSRGSLRRHRGRTALCRPSDTWTCPAPRCLPRRPPSSESMAVAVGNESGHGVARKRVPFAHLRSLCRLLATACTSTG